MPDYIANGQAAWTPEQKMAMRSLYFQLLDDFERQNRRNNMAAALTYVVRASLLAVYGRQLSQAEIDQLGWNFGASPAPHQSASRPSPSNLRPSSSKPCDISWPITAPMAP